MFRHGASTGLSSQVIMASSGATGAVDCFEAYQPGQGLPPRLTRLWSFTPQRVRPEDSRGLYHPLRREPWYRRTNLTGYVYRGAVLHVCLIAW